VNLSFLKKIGQDIAQAALVGGKALATVDGYGPLINAIVSAPVALKAATVEKVADSSLSKIDDIIKTVEGVGQLSAMSGAQKYQAAGGLAVQVFSDAMSLVGHDVQDEDLLRKAQSEFNDAVRLLVQARVDFLNSLKAK